jgi:MraZ protein
LFFGSSDHSLDPKNRLIIPARFRDALTAQGKSLEFFLVPGLDECLFLFARDQYWRIASRFEDRSFGKPEIRKFQRFFFGEASQCFADAMGRILIPDNLKRHASIDRDVKIVGAAHRIEIWDQARWEQFRADNRSAYQEMAGDLL